MSHEDRAAWPAQPLEALDIPGLRFAPAAGGEAGVICLLTLLPEPRPAWPAFKKSLGPLLSASSLEKGRYDTSEEFGVRNF